MPSVEIVAGATGFPPLLLPETCQTVGALRKQLGDALGGAKVLQESFLEQFKDYAQRLSFLSKKDGVPLSDASALPVSPNKLYLGGPTVAVCAVVSALRRKLKVKSLSARGPSSKSSSVAGSTSARQSRPSGPERKSIRNPRGFHNPRFDEEAAAQQDREAAEEVIHFWCEELTTEDWFRQSHILDDRIRKEFGALHSRAAAGELAGWAHEKDTCLALVIILDQFSRNLYRGSNSAYSCDAAARAAANMAIMRGDDKTWLPGPKRWALYLPFMHSDDLQDKARCVNLMREGTLGVQNLRGAERHKEALPKLQASLSGSGHERKSKAGPKPSTSNVDKAHLTHQATPEHREDFALSDEESDFSDDEDVQIFKANTASHSRPRDGRKTYSMQAALEISSLPVLPLNHAHAQRFREMRLDAQMQQAYFRDRKDASRVVRYQCLVCHTEHEFRMSKGAVGDG